ncbi:hypothetical protein HanIR_Chr13g0632651 [Helianthus annuus]|nr:hypothetical protein HanIR_Chr13g0632651 [Helianthus annuus]
MLQLLSKNFVLLLLLLVFRRCFSTVIANGRFGFYMRMSFGFTSNCDIYR